MQEVTFISSIQWNKWSCMCVICDVAAKWFTVVFWVVMRILPMRNVSWHYRSNWAT